MGESLDKLFEGEPYARKLGMRLLEVEALGWPW